MSHLSARCDASPIQASGPSPVAARRPRNAPGTLPALPALSTLLAAVLLAGCTVTQPSQIPERMLTPEAVQEAARQDANGEPYYLSYQVGETGLTAAFDDGSHTYVEFERPVPSDLSCFDNAGALLSCEAVGNVLAVEGTHAGILLRQWRECQLHCAQPQGAHPAPATAGQHARLGRPCTGPQSRAAEGPAATGTGTQRRGTGRPEPESGRRPACLDGAAGCPYPARCSREPASAADRHGTRLLRHRETASYREPTNEPGFKARGSLKANRPEGATATTPSVAPRPGKPAGTTPATASGPHNVIVSSSRWTSLPFADNSAQLDARHPVMTRLGKSLAQADEVRVEVLSSAEDALLAQARPAATRVLLQRQGVISSRIRTSTRTLPAARSTQQGAAPGQPTLRIQLLKDGLPLEAA
ncbi:hypothetical protein V8H18_00895 [Lautropia mirabilis]